MSNKKILWPLKNIYRHQINEEHIQFILDNSNMHVQVLQKIMDLCVDNPYHNYGHTLGVMRTILEISKAQSVNRKKTTQLLFAGGLHDAFHPGVATGTDELVSVLAMYDHITDRDLSLCGLNSADRPFIRDMIMATLFSKRGKTDDPIAFIIQDADIGYLGKGPYIYLFASMGLLDEFSSVTFTDPDPVRFIRVEQKQFIDMVINMSPMKNTFFLSEGAQKILIDPRKVLDQLLQWPDRIYWLAYDLRQADISIDQFITLIDRQVQLS
jgi:hypothetical protein